MVKRISNVPFHLPINELQLRCFSYFVYKQMSMYDQHLHFNIHASEKKSVANGDLREVWERAIPLSAGLGGSKAG